MRNDLRFVVNGFDFSNRPMRVSPPNFPHVKGATPWTPDLRNVPGAMLGFGKRVARALPTPDVDLQAEWFEYVRKVIIPRFPVLPADTDISPETWLTPENTPSYTESRREEFRGLLRENGIRRLTKKEKKCKSFIKEEYYSSEPKHYRTINSRSDQAKLTFGPVLKPIEKVVFKFPYFIKYIPVPERPGFLFNLLSKPGAKILVSDYTAFESHFTPEVMANVEMKLYEHMLQNVPGAQAILRDLKDCLCGTNYCQFKHFTSVVLATRMSGEMCTSLGNGFTNWCLMEFAAFKHNTSVNGVVEGDDGIFIFENNIIPEESFFASLGWTVKLDQVTSITEAGFCGMYFDPEDLIVVADPSEPLGSFGWFPSKYIHARETRWLELLRSKSYSLAYQYAGCPILQSLGHYGLRCTKHVDLRRYLNKDRNISAWDKEQLLEAMAHPVGLKEVPYKTRLLMEKQFGISVRSQLIIEEYLDSLTTLQSLDHPMILEILPEGYKTNWTHYVVHNDADDQELGLRKYDKSLDIYADKINFTPTALRNRVDWALMTK